MIAIYPTLRKQFASMLCSDKKKKDSCSKEVDHFEEKHLHSTTLLEEKYKMLNQSRVELNTYFCAYFFDLVRWLCSISILEAKC